MEKVIVRSDETAVAMLMISERYGFASEESEPRPYFGSYMVLGPGKIPILPNAAFEMVLILSEKREAFAGVSDSVTQEEVEFIDKAADLNVMGRTVVKLVNKTQFQPYVLLMDEESTFSAQVKMLVKAGVRDETAEQFLVDLQRKRPFYDFKNYVAGMEFTSGGPFGLENLREDTEEVDTGTIPTGFRALGSETNIIPGSARMEHAEQLIRAIVIKELIEELKTQDDIGPYLAAELKRALAGVREKDIKRAELKRPSLLMEEAKKKFEEGTW